MKIIRTIVFILAAALSVSSGRAQTLPFSVTLDTAPLNANSEDDYPFIGSLTNTSSDSLRIQFDRVQIVPRGWSSSVCFGQSCYAPSVSQASDVFAPGESRQLIVHQYPTTSDVPDTMTIYLRISTPDLNEADTTLLTLVTYYTPPDPPLIFKFSDGTNFSQSFMGSGLHLMSPTLENHSGDSVDYDLSMQTQLPLGWSVGMQVGDSSGTDIHYTFYPMGDLDGNDQHPIQFRITAPTVTQVDSAVIFLSVHPQTSNPADSANYRFVAIVRPANGVSAAGSGNSGLAVVSAWPNPLGANTKLNLDIITDRSGAGKAYIYTIEGMEAAVIDLGGLSKGSNHLQIADLNVPSGNYIIRIQQVASFCEPVHVNLLR